METPTQEREAEFWTVDYEAATEPAIEIRPNDVFRFRYHEDEKREWGWDGRYHCFDGTLKADVRDDGSITLRDTFWGDSTSRCFTPEEAQQKGALTFVCNLDEVDPIKEHNTVYYDDEDVFTLYIHSGYQNEYYLRRGAERSPEKMRAVLMQQEESAKLAISSAERDLETIAHKRQLLEEGDTSFYL